MKMKEKQVGEFKIKELCLNGMIIGIATDIGPRILYVADSDRPDFNLFGISPKAGSKKTSEGIWQIYGGHRLWSAPEAMPRSYSIDNKPVKIEKHGDGVLIYGNPEIQNSIQKEIEIKPHLKGRIEVIHRIKNIGRWPITLGCWALSVMRQKGFAVIPLKPGKQRLLPDRRILVWPYTDILDERLILQDKYIFVQQKPSAKNLIKIGTIANPSWIAYCVGGSAFVKTFCREEGKYPDFGCNVEVYTNADFLELETLSLLKTIEPLEYIQHTEIWSIFNVGELIPDSYNIEKKISKLAIIY